MSRCGRAQELLDQWREHPRGCTDDHGFRDGYDGPCTDDAWDIAQTLDGIDPFFRHDEIARLRRLVLILGGDDLLAYIESTDGLHALDQECITDLEFARLLGKWQKRQR